MAVLANIPQSRIADPDSGMVSREWLQYFLNPQVQSIVISNGVVVSGGVGVTSGGTGLTTAPASGQFLVGDGLGGYTLVSTIPTSALPAFTGDASSTAGTTILTLATVNAGAGSYGAATSVATYTVNAKGLITSSATVPITGAASMTVVGGFGCNTKAAQTAVASGASVVTTAATNVAPFGYVTQAQADRIVTLLNTVQAALIANGILS
jgi:hypothetical protein